MGYRELIIKVPTDYSDHMLEKEVAKSLHIKLFDKIILKKSLDARNKSNIYWQIKLGISSKELKGGDFPLMEDLQIPHKKRETKVIIIGSGPAGFFSALLLQKSGFKTTIIERGKDIERRKKDIDFFEKNGTFQNDSNYAFGEGGAGTFSDGKLTSRTKKISKEKSFILKAYIDAGAPEEIAYMTHPHLGSDRLLKITYNLRKQFLQLGGQIIFDCLVTNIIKKSDSVISIETSKGEIEGDVFLFATGHSSYETYRYLIRKGVQYRNKNFAIGSRVEHHQDLINRAQWGCNLLSGVKAAEYRLTNTVDNELSVYSFCMCPGGKVVPAAPYNDTNIVNGMSLYKRDSPFANSAIVAGLNLERIYKRDFDPLESLQWLEDLERSFFIEKYKAPASTINNFINGKSGSNLKDSSYPLGLLESDLGVLLPPFIVKSMKRGLLNFTKKIKGFEEGNIIGLESKTSALLQVHRDKEALVDGFTNLYMCGEGSGFSGGIISSAADGIKGALSIIAKY